MCHEGLKLFEPGAAVYIRPMYWGIDSGPLGILPLENSTGFAICLEELPMAEAAASTTLTTTQFRRPVLADAVVNAKAGCLYPNNARMLVEAKSKGFQNAISQDAIGNVAETATSNVFMVKDGVVMTPIATGCFLAGITRSRIIGLLRDDGVEVLEKTLSVEDFEDADEIFTSGNAQKIMHATQFQDRHLQYGPLSRRARELYWDWSAGTAAI